MKNKKTLLLLFVVLFVGSTASVYAAGDVVAKTAIKKAENDTTVNNTSLEEGESVGVEVSSQDAAAGYAVIGENGTSASYTLDADGTVQDEFCEVGGEEVDCSELPGSYTNGIVPDDYCGEDCTEIEVDDSGNQVK